MLLLLLYVFGMIDNIDNQTKTGGKRSSFHMPSRGGCPKPQEEYIEGIEGTKNETQRNRTDTKLGYRSRVTTSGGNQASKKDDAVGLLMSQI